MTRLMGSGRPLTADQKQVVTHQADEECQPIHCFIHDRDEPRPEPLPVVGMVCYECNHYYRDGQELQEAWLRDQATGGITAVSVEHLAKKLSEMDIALPPVSEILCCPHCDHDF